MKKLTNVSPFLLLLVPVFVVMLFAFTTNGNSANNNEEGLAQNTANTNTSIVKTAAGILK